MNSAQIKVMKNGPLLVEGNCSLIDSTGKESAKEGNFALCRCGGSKNKPFCDEHISRSDSTIQNSWNKDHLPYFLGSMILAVMIKIEPKAATGLR